MTWHYEATLDSCAGYLAQLHALEATSPALFQSQWVQALISYYENVAGAAVFSLETPTPQVELLPASINEYSLGYGSDDDNVPVIVVGLEHGYDLNNLAYAGPPHTPPKSLFCLALEASALSALWRLCYLPGTHEAEVLAEINRVSRMNFPANGAEALHAFQRNPTYHFLPFGHIPAGHTWRKAARVLSVTGGGGMTDIAQVFNDTMYMLEISHIPARITADGNGAPTAQRLAFLSRLLASYGQANPNGRIWFHGGMNNFKYAAARAELVRAFLGVKVLPEMAVTDLAVENNHAKPCHWFQSGNKRAVVTPHLTARRMGSYWAELRASGLIT